MIDFWPALCHTTPAMGQRRDCLVALWNLIIASPIYCNLGGFPFLVS